MPKRTDHLSEAELNDLIARYMQPETSFHLAPSPPKNPRERRERAQHQLEHEETERARKRLEQRLEAHLSVTRHKEDARRRIEAWLGMVWETAQWNAWRAERGLPPLPRPTELFWKWEVAFAGYGDKLGGAGLTPEEGEDSSVPPQRPMYPDVPPAAEENESAQRPAQTAGPRLLVLGDD